MCCPHRVHLEIPPKCHPLSLMVFTWTFNCHIHLRSVDKITSQTCYCPQRIQLGVCTFLLDAFTWSSRHSVVVGSTCVRESAWSQLALTQDDPPHLSYFVQNMGKRDLFRKGTLCWLQELPIALLSLISTSEVRLSSRWMGMHEIETISSDSSSASPHLLYTRQQLLSSWVTSTLSIRLWDVRCIETLLKSSHYLSGLYFDKIGQEFVSIWGGDGLNV